MKRINENFEVYEFPELFSKAEKITDIFLSENKSYFIFTSMLNDLADSIDEGVYDV